MRLDNFKPVRFHFKMRSLVVLCLLLPLAGCGLMKKKPPMPRDNRTGQAKLVGVIEMVNPEQNYVLIHCDTRPTLEAGTQLIGLDSAGQKSKLLVTPERKGNYLTADIQEGAPIVGSLVLQKIRDSDTLPAPPNAASPLTEGVIMPASAAPSFELPVERPPPIPEIQFPSRPSLPARSDLPLPVPIEPVADPSTLPPVIR